MISIIILISEAVDSNILKK